MIRLVEASRHSITSLAMEPLAGGMAVFAGIGSPMTHAIGMGLRGEVRVEELVHLESFFTDRGSACIVDLCPLAHASVHFYFQTRPYRLAECNNVMAREIAADESFEVPPGVRRIGAAEYTEWSSIVCQAFSEQMPVTDEAIAMMSATCKASEAWIAGAGEPVAASAMDIHDDVAHLYGDATLPSARRAGWHSALIRSRLAAAQQRGCRIAMASVLPGSQSHRNYEHAGFRLLYMRVTLVRNLENS